MCEEVWVRVPTGSYAHEWWCMCVHVCAHIERSRNLQARTCRARSMAVAACNSASRPACTHAAWSEPPTTPPGVLLPAGGAAASAALLAAAAANGSCGAKGGPRCRDSARTVDSKHLPPSPRSIWGPHFWTMIYIAQIASCKCAQALEVHGDLCRGLPSIHRMHVHMHTHSRMRAHAASWANAAGAVQFTGVLGMDQQTNPLAVHGHELLRKCRYRPSAPSRAA